MRKIKLHSRPDTNHVQGLTSFSGSVPDIPSTTCKQKTSATLFHQAKTRTRAESKRRARSTGRLHTQKSRLKAFPNTQTFMPDHPMVHFSTGRDYIWLTVASGRKTGVTANTQWLTAHVCGGAGGRETEMATTNKKSDFIKRNLVSVFDIRFSWKMRQNCTELNNNWMAWRVVVWDMISDVQNFYLIQSRHETEVNIVLFSHIVTYT